MSALKGILLGILALTLIFMIVFGGYFLQRKINYTLSYKHMVEQTVKEMVKPETLK